MSGLQCSVSASGVYHSSETECGWGEVGEPGGALPNTEVTHRSHLLAAWTTVVARSLCKDGGPWSVLTGEQTEGFCRKVREGSVVL